MRRRRRTAIALTLALVAALAWAVGVGPLTSAVETVGSSGKPVDLGAFAPGACRAFAPATDQRHETVFLDAGHGGVDPGGVGTTTSGRVIHESEETLAVELDTMAVLRSHGFTVVVSRTGDSTVAPPRPGFESGGVLTLEGVHDDVAARDLCANDAHAAVLVGIYFDASADPAVAGGLTAYDAARPFASANLRLAHALQASVLAALNARGWDIPDDGVPADTRLGSSVGDPAAGGIAAQAAAYDHLLLIGPPVSGYFTTPSRMPGAVIEPLYLTDPFEGSIADSPAGQRVIAQGIASAVQSFLASPAAPSR